MKHFAIGLGIVASFVAGPRLAFGYSVYVSTTGNDANAGTSGAPVATLQRAHDLVAAAAPSESVFIYVAPGLYRCNSVAWTYRNANYVTKILPQFSVPSPAVDSFDDPDRPIFSGRQADGTDCDGQTTWFSFTHGHVRARVTVSGLKVTYWRGGISLNNYHTTTTAVNQEIVIDNMFFERIGDYYFSRGGAGKGAILMTRSFGNTIKNNYFRYIRNTPETAGLVHGIYFASTASRHTIYDNYFHSLTGSAIKLSDYSNNNTITGNGFSYVDASYVLTDRWCGVAGDDIATQCDGEAKCPSWNNVFHIEENTFSNVNGKAKIYPIPTGQTCRYAPATSNLRADLGTAGSVYGEDGLNVP